MERVIMFPKVQSLDVHAPDMRLRALLVAQTVFEIGLNAGIYKEKDRRAIAFVLWHKAYEEPLLLRHTGDTFPDDSFRTNCFHLAPEKIERAFEFGDISSHFSRNPDEKMYGGAIVLPITDESYWGISGSGQKEWEDEAFSIIVAMHTFGILMFTKEVNQILVQSDNFKFTCEFLDLITAKIGPPQSPLAA